MHKRNGKLEEERDMCCYWTMTTVGLLVINNCHCGTRGKPIRAGPPTADVVRYAPLCSYLTLPPTVAEKHRPDMRSQVTNNPCHIMRPRYCMSFFISSTASLLVPSFSKYVYVCLLLVPRNVFFSSV